MFPASPVPAMIPGTFETTFIPVTPCWKTAPDAAVGTAIFPTSAVKASTDAHTYWRSPAAPCSSI